MTANNTPGSQGSSRPFAWLAGVGLLLLVLILLFFRSFQSDQVLFSNDGPLGLNSAAYASPTTIFFGCWGDLNWVGGEMLSASPTITHWLRYALGNLAFANFYTPVSLLLLGLCAGVFCRQLGGGAAACTLTGLAAALNSDFFSNACWGLASRPLTLAAVFLVLSLLLHPATRPRWVRTSLAGLVLGIVLMEGYDVGAIFSLYVAAFAMFLAWIEESQPAKALLKGASRVAIIALFAAFMSAQTLSTLVGTQIKGIAGMDQNQQSVGERWDWATQWSLPKIETLRVIIPGLFGYRMDTENGGNYWGTVGQQPGWETHHQGEVRSSGSGEYAGILVIILAVWAAAQSLRHKGSPFSDRERKIIAFWYIAALISLLLAWGRFAPFYRIVYVLPFFSTVRNPIKFMFPFHLGMLILFGYGLLGLSRSFLSQTAGTATSLSAQVKRWWGTRGSFDRAWTMGMLAFFGMSLLGALIYAASRTDVERFLKSTGFQDADPATAKFAGSIFSFSLGEMGWYLLFLALAIVLLAGIFSGALAGRRSKWAWAALGLLLVLDLVRANAPWIVYWNYRDKYATNPVIDILRQKPYEQRVQLLPFQINDQFDQFQRLYHSEWKQHPFQYYNIQSLDIIQEPRVAADNAAYRAAFRGANPTLMVRLWELTNTRYLLGLGGNFADQLNQQFDPEKRRFRLHTAFNLVPKHGAVKRYEDFTAQVSTNGVLGLIEFTGALPRLKLYSQWQTVTNDDLALQELANLKFDPAQTVLVAGPLRASPAGTNQNAGAVEFLNYTPKYNQLNAKAATPSVLLLNDKYHPDWKVWVDGKPETLLRCNYLMRGVYLPAGEHRVEFRFQPPVTALYVSLAALGVGLMLCLILLFSTATEKKSSRPTAQPPPH